MRSGKAGRERSSILRRSEDSEFTITTPIGMVASIDVRLEKGTLFFLQRDIQDYIDRAVDRCAVEKIEVKQNKGTLQC